MQAHGSASFILFLFLHGARQCTLCTIDVFAVNSHSSITIGMNIFAVSLVQVNVDKKIVRKLSSRPRPPEVMATGKELMTKS